MKIIFVGVTLALLVGADVVQARPTASPTAPPPTPSVPAVKPLQHRFSKMPMHTAGSSQATQLVGVPADSDGPGYPTFNVTIDNKSFCKPVAETKPLVNINKMTAKQRSRVSAAISKAITPARVQHHYWLNHDDAGQFLDGHRRYLACVKHEVARAGLQLPIWSPNQTVPRTLFVVKRSPKNCTTIDDSISCPGGWYYEPLQNNHPALVTPVNLTMPAVCNFRSKQAFYSELIDWHNQVHATVGGTMDTFDSPASPLFWPWHNYVDSLYTDFQKCGNKG